MTSPSPFLYIDANLKEYLGDTYAGGPTREEMQVIYSFPTSNTTLITNFYFWHKAVKVL